MRDIAEEDPVDVAAREEGISFISLDGSIGCMVNGAGLAMTTMDLIKRAGGEPANFLDIGGGAKADKVEAAMRLILADTRACAPSWSTSSAASPAATRWRTAWSRHAPAGAARADGRAHRRHELRGSRAHPGRSQAIPTSRQPRPWTKPWRRSWLSPRAHRSQRGRAMSILVGRDTRLLVQGITGPRGRVPRPADAGLRHQHRGRHDPRQGRPDRADASQSPSSTRAARR